MPTPPPTAGRLTLRRFRRLLFRSLRLRCPWCGRGRLFRSWFRMHDDCPVCHTHLEREAGFFLGSIYFNYGVTAIIAAIAYPVLFFTGALPPPVLTISMVAFVFLFPIWFFRYARSLWLAFDQFVDPRPLARSEEKGESAEEIGEDF